MICLLGSTDTSVCLGAKGVSVANISGSVLLGISERQETLLALF